jgi:sphinganine-1-phosphate aldolase
MSLYPYVDRYPVMRTMPEDGRPRADVLAEVVAMSTAEDAMARAGHMSGSVYSGDWEHYAFLTEVFGHYGHANVLQRDVYPSATRFEGEIIAMAADLFHAPQPIGVLTSGGSESLMNSMLVYREWGRERGIEHPNIVMPVTAHAAFDKGAHYFGIELRKAAVTDRFVADLDSVAALIDGNTVGLVGSAGTYPHGLVDPIPELGALALAHGVNLHVDGCLGGFVLCWADECGVEVPVFDFRVPGVTSLSADTHKYGYGLKGSSVLLYRDSELRRHQYFALADWPGGLYSSPGMSGSRSGGVIAAAWAAMVTLGRSGYRDVARELFATAHRLVDIIGSHTELRVLGDPHFNVAFAAAEIDEPIDIFHVNDALAAAGWRLNGLQLPPALHFCVTRPNTAPGVTDAFAVDLAAAVDHARRHRGTAARSGAVYGGGVPAARAVEGMMRWLDATQALPPAGTDGL